MNFIRDFLARNVLYFGLNSFKQQSNSVGSAVPLKKLPVPEHRLPTPFPEPASKGRRATWHRLSYTLWESKLTDLLKVSICVLGESGKQR
jgi:hypothetical protein